MSSPPSYDNVQSTPSNNQSIEQPPMLLAMQPATVPQMQFTPAGVVFYVTQPQQPQHAVEYVCTNSQPFPPQQPQPPPSYIYADAVNQLPPVVHQQFMQSFVGHQLFACFVMWCCNWIFGLIAWILAMVAESAKFNNRNEARRLGHASLGLSISGIIVSVIVVAIVLGVVLGYCSGYKVDGICYKYRYYCSSTSYSYGYCCNAREIYLANYCYFE